MRCVACRSFFPFVVGCVLFDACCLSVVRCLAFCLLVLFVVACCL